MKIEEAIKLHKNLCNDLKKNLTYPNYLNIKDQLEISQTIIDFLYTDYLLNFGKELTPKKNSSLQDLYDLLYNCYGITRNNLINVRRGMQNGK